MAKSAKKGKKIPQATKEVVAISNGVFEMFNRTGVQGMEGVTALAFALGTTMGQMLKKGTIKPKRVASTMQIMIAAMEMEFQITKGD